LQAEVMFALDLVFLPFSMLSTTCS